MVYRLHNFEALGKEGFSTTSVACHGYQWKLLVYPWGNGDEANKNEKISVYLKRGDEGESSVSAAWSILIGDVELKIVFNFDPSTKLAMGWPQFMDRSSTIQALDKSGTLTVNVELRCWLPEPPTWKPNHTFEGQLRKLYQTKKGSDVTFMLGGGVIVRAHRFVLFVRCPGLNEIVSENIDGSNIEIEGDADLFEILIRFLYLEALPDDFVLRPSGVELLKLADRFGCVDLKMYLEAEIVDSDLLSLETAAEYLALADGHSCALLKEAAMDIVIANSVDVVKTIGWDTLKESEGFCYEKAAR